MTKLEQVEKAVEELSPEEFVAFSAWFAEFQTAQWDRQMEADVAAGKLDAVAAASLADFRTHEYKGMVETIHLLSSPANAARLLKAKAEIDSGDYHEQS